MPLIQLQSHVVRKPWGRRDLPPPFSELAQEGDPIGEVWFDSPDPDGDDLLVKYLFTSEKLSVQVHPDDAAAQAAGYPRGKDEAWVVLRAEAGATIGLGPIRTLTRSELRAAAVSGAVEHELHWRAVVRGDIFYSTAGTIHALGAGLTILEIQQNVDCTYRLYDYGRDRELHIEAAIASADLHPYEWRFEPETIDEGRILLAHGPKIVLERWSDVEIELVAEDGPVWLIPLTTGITLGNEGLSRASVYKLFRHARLRAAAGTDLLVAYPGRAVRSLKGS